MNGEREKTFRVRTILLVQLIEKYPGVTFSNLESMSGIKKNTLNHLVKELIRKQIIRAEKLKNHLRLYPVYIDKQESKILRTLEQKTSRRIIFSLIKDARISLEDLTSQNNVEPEFLFSKLSYLVSQGIVKVEHLDKNQTFQLADKSQISKIIMKYVLE